MLLYVYNTKLNKLIAKFETICKSAISCTNFLFQNCILFPFFPRQAIPLLAANKTTFSVSFSWESFVFFNFYYINIMNFNFHYIYIMKFNFHYIDIMNFYFCFTVLHPHTLLFQPLNLSVFVFT